MRRFYIWNWEKSINCNCVQTMKNWKCEKLFWSIKSRINLCVSSFFFFCSPRTRSNVLRSILCNLIVNRTKRLMTFDNVQLIAETKLNDFLIINVQWCNRYIILKFFTLYLKLKDKSNRDVYRDVYIPYIIEITLTIWLVNI